MPDNTDDIDDIGYAEALTELEGILAELEDDSIDIDVLAARVRRATDLIRACRRRIGSARMEVERIVAELDEAEDGGGSEDVEGSEDRADSPDEADEGT